jgi:hypothetical protein
MADHGQQTNITVLTSASKGLVLATWVHGQRFAVACPPAEPPASAVVYDALLRHVEGGSARNGHPGEPGEMGRAI